MPPMEMVNPTPEDALIVDAPVRCDPCLAFDNVIRPGVAFGLTAYGIDGVLCQEHADEIGVAGVEIIVDAEHRHVIPVPANMRADG